ncbi:MAG TPA: uroporphyrinogen decarboxylase family protein [Dehalococcoidia bacterium]|nr:uroporphyrinogen decarboxylase family protein [Dehalococcoidia bacterium]
MVLSDLLAGSGGGRVPFVPLVYGLAARLEQMAVGEMAADPGKLARSLRNAQRLFGYDAVVSSFDLSLEAEACGCEVRRAAGNIEVVGHPLADEGRIAAFDPEMVGERGRVPVVLEATRRLRQELGAAALLGVVAGPLTLAGHLRGEGLLEGLRNGSASDEEVLDLAGAAGLRMARLFGELRVDAVMVVEIFPAGADGSQLSLVEAPLASIWNVVRYYKAYPMLMARCSDTLPLDKLFGLGADGVLVSGPFAMEEVRQAAQARHVCFSLGVPLASFLADKGESARSVTDDLRLAGGSRFFLSSEWEVPVDTPPENLHGMVRAIREASI